MAKNRTIRKRGPKQDPPDPLEAQSDTDPATAEMTSVEDSSEQTPGQHQQTPAGHDDQTTAFPIVGIGASAGGLAAFEAFFANLPTDTSTGIAFVLVQHLDPDHKSILAELVRRYTRMKVHEVENGMAIEPNCTFIIPPNKDMALLHGKFHLIEPAAPRGLRLPIDFFFRSLAQDLNEQAMCIVLTGTGTDGTLGLRAIKEAGGMAMVQSPESAGYDGMPRSAIATGLADYVLPPNEMPAQLMAYVQHAFGHKPMVAAPEVVPWLQKIFVILRAQTGHDFSGYKQSTIRRRVERRMAVNQVEQVEHYVRYLRQNPSEIETLFQELLIGVTGFFRDPEAYEVLATQVIPRIFADRPANAPIRVWVAGCATGEEAYSIAILLQEHADALDKEFNIQVFATDIDHESIEKARAGVYPVNIAADVAPERLARFFTQENGDVYRINKSIRDRLIFAEQDVIKDPPFSRLALISCRNLLIYMESELQKKIVPLFHYALVPGGFLVLGSSETIGEFTGLFEAVDRKWKIYQCKEGVYAAATRLDMPVLPLKPEAAQSTATVEEPKDKRASIRTLTERALLQDYAPTCVTVNEQGEILYIHGRTGKYLELAPGDISVNILRTAREGLRLELVTALRRAMIHKETVRYNRLPVRTNGDTQSVNLIVKPAEYTSREPGLIFVIFEDAEAIPAVERTPASGPAMEEDGAHSPQDQHIAALERELRVKAEYLQTTIEELETANEELKSTNEELQSTNEELQSTNEELETSKEELQSVNEELVTVNTELQQKIDDLSRANNDMNNLLSGTGIGTIFVDHQLRIQRFTPAATEIVNLIQTDIGRPVGHIVSNLTNYDQLVEDTRQVLNTLVSREAEVRTVAGQWYLMRILPYRTVENDIEGAVLTFVRITEQKRLQETLGESEQRYRVLFESVTDAVIVSDRQDHIVDCSLAALRSYGYSREEFLGLKWTDIVHPDYHTMLRDQRETMLSEGSVVYESVHRRKDGQLLTVEVHVGTIEYLQRPAFLAVVRDITGRKEVIKQLNQLAAIVRDSSDAVIVQNFDRTILAWNPAAEKMYGWREAEVLEKSADLYVPLAKRDELAELLDKLNRGETAEPLETQRLTKDGRSLTIWLTATILVDATEKPYAVTMIEREITRQPA